VKIVEVRWKDACRFSCDDAKRELVASYKPCETSTVGFLIYEDKEQVNLAMTWFKEGEHVTEGFSHAWVIPKGMIMAIKILSEV
jgi:hypothetical protein